MSRTNNSRKKGARNSEKKEVIKSASCELYDLVIKSYSDETITAKDGTQYTKVECLVNADSGYGKELLLSFFGATADAFIEQDPLEGEFLEVSANLNTRTFVKEDKSISYFTSVDVWKFTIEEAQAPEPAPEPAARSMRGKQARR